MAQCSCPEVLASESIVNKFNLLRSVGFQFPRQRQDIEYLVDWHRLIAEGVRGVHLLVFRHNLFVNKCPLVIQSHLGNILHHDGDLLCGVIQNGSEVDHISVQFDIGETDFAY
jgi:hypothetical protein